MAKTPDDRVLKMALSHAEQAVKRNAASLDKMRESRISMRPQVAQVAPLSSSGGMASGHDSWPSAPSSGVVAGQGAPDQAGGVDDALQWLIQKESSGRTDAKNPNSSAFGLGQLIRANREAYAKKLGIQNPDTTDYNEQLAMMKAYIADRYGSPEKAKQFWERNNWY